VRSGQDEELKSLRAKLTELESTIQAIAFTDNNPALLTLIEQRDATVPSTLKNIEPDGQQYSVNRPDNVASDGKRTQPNLSSARLSYQSGKQARCAQ